MTEIVRTKSYWEKDKLHNRLRKVIEVPRVGSLWGAKYTVTPALSGTVYGDGRALITLETIHSRPWYYVIRGDSGWRMDLDQDHDPDTHVDFRYLVDYVLQDLEEEFGDGGEPDWEEQQEWEAKVAALKAAGAPKKKWPPAPKPRPWPALDDRDGCAWGRMAWPKLRGVRFEPTPAVPCWKTGLLVAAA